MKFVNIEKLLPFGYLVLVILGIVKESVFYYQLGINILKYSNLMDILISPIADLTAHPIVLIAFSTYICLLYVAFTMVKKYHNKEWARRILEIKEEELPLNADDLATKVGSKFLAVTAFGIMTFFLGIGLGNGFKVAEKIKSNKLNYNHKITFEGSNSKTVFLIGNNSSNYFYIEPGNRHVKVAPVGAIKEVEFLK